MGGENRNLLTKNVSETITKTFGYFFPDFLFVAVPTYKYYVFFHKPFIIFSAHKISNSPRTTKKYTQKNMRLPSL